MIFWRRTRHLGNARTGSRPASGFALVSAIFLLVVLAALGAAMVSISTVQHQSSTLDVQGVQAYQAARAGIEWGLYQKLQAGGCAAATNLVLPAGSSLSAFTVTVVCMPDTGLGLNIDTAVIQATACNLPAAGICPNPTPGSSNYVQRVVQVQL